MNGDHQPLHVVMFPYLDFGHFVSSIQLSNRLADNGIKITFLIPPTFIPKILSLLHPNIAVLSYQLPSVARVPAGIESVSGNLASLMPLLEALEASKQQIADRLRELSPQVIIFDFVHHWLPPLADSLGIKTVLFFAGSADSAASLLRLIRSQPTFKLMLAVNQWLPSSLLEAFSRLKSSKIRDKLHLFKRKDGTGLSFCDRLAATITLSSAVALKSAFEIESKTIKYFSSRCRKPLLLTGALISNAPAGELEPRWEKWLSKYPAGSVLFCSFGREVCIPDDHINQIVAALEMSGSPFFIVMNLSPKAEVEVVEERMGGRGMVYKGWMQQQHILRHSSVGVYIGCTGLSSMMEAVACGCQVVLLPMRGVLFSDGKVMAKDLKAGMAVKTRSRSDGTLTKEALRRAVWMVMQEKKTEKATRVRANSAKLRLFLINESAQQHYIQKFIAKLRWLVLSPSS